MPATSGGDHRGAVLSLEDGAKFYNEWQDRYFRELESSDPSEGVLFHYTNAAGLLGILEKSEIWFTRREHLNDPSEFQYGLRLLQSLLGERRESLPEASLQKLFCELVLDLCQVANIDTTFGFYVASFSLSGDDLEQWRLYGDNGRGFAIGLNPSVFRLTQDHQGPEQRYFMQRVRYGDDGVGRLIPVLDEALNIVSKYEGASLDGPTTYSFLREMANLLLGGLIPQLAVIKHPAYAHEREVRLILTEVSGQSEPVVDVRVRGSDLVPYVRVPMPMLRSQISAIHVGPAANPTASNALASLLKGIGISFSLVLFSELPYRGA